LVGEQGSPGRSGHHYFIFDIIAVTYKLQTQTQTGAGERGRSGPTGPKGLPGMNGRKGLPGPRGFPAYQEREPEVDVKLLLLLGIKI